MIATSTVKLASAARPHATGCFWLSNVASRTHEDPAYRVRSYLGTGGTGVPRRPPRCIHWHPGTRWAGSVSNIAKDTRTLTDAHDRLKIGLFGLFTFEAIYPLSKRFTHWPQAWLGRPCLSSRVEVS